MYKIGELIKWCSPLDADYSYGTILEINRNHATVLGSGYYAGVKFSVHLRCIEKIEKGGKSFGGNKKYRK